MASQITGLTIVYSSVSSDDQRKHQSSASLAFARGIHRWPVNFPHKGPVTRKMFPFHDLFMLPHFSFSLTFCTVWCSDVFCIYHKMTVQNGRQYGVNFWRYNDFVIRCCLVNTRKYYNRAVAVDSSFITVMKRAHSLYALKWALHLFNCLSKGKPHLLLMHCSLPLSRCNIECVTFL